MSAQSWPITWWEFTGRYTPFIGNQPSPFMRNMKTGELVPGWRHLPFGACYDQNIHPQTLQPEYDWPCGDDGKSIVCICPRSDPPTHTDKGHWHIDGRASNCTMKEDNAHRCWIRHGTIGGALHVDKDGLTCAAGAGSIQMAGWHGFLHYGVLHK